jgi:ankyrin repeat protein
MSEDNLKDSFPPPPSQQEVDAFVVAAGWGKDAEITAFLEKHKDAIDRKNRFGNTALIYAAWLGQPSTVELLLEKGAAIDAQSDSGLTALMCAAWRGRLEMVRFLIDKGASIDEVKGKGKTAAMLAREKGFSEIVTLLEQQAELHRRQEHERAEAKIKSVTEPRLERLKTQRPAKPPFKNKPPGK